MLPPSTALSNSEGRLVAHPVPSHTRRDRRLFGPALRERPSFDRSRDRWSRRAIHGLKERFIHLGDSIRRQHDVYCPWLHLKQSWPAMASCPSSSRSTRPKGQLWLLALLAACAALVPKAVQAHTIDLAPHMKQCFFEDLSHEDVRPSTVPPEDKAS